jgi:polyphosphate glucokinase
MRVLVIDIGGTHTKLAVADTSARLQFDSPAKMDPQELVRRVHEHTEAWAYDVIAMGYPGRVSAAGPTTEPGNLGTGWVGFDFAAAFNAPVRIVNDAILQALGAYQGGRMLFLGFGTGVGSALVTEQVAVPLELGELPYRSGSLADSLGRQGFARLGQDAWRDIVLDVTPTLRRAFLADDVVIGGGHSELVHPPPPGIRCGGNEDAIEGGARLWTEIVEPHDVHSSPRWRVVA